MKTATAMVLVALLSTAAHAQLAATKPSKLVILTTTGGEGECTRGVPMNGVFRPDGNLAPFTIPVDQVLVVTGVDWTAFTTRDGALVPNVLGTISLNVHSPTPFSNDTSLWQDASLSDSTGRAAKSSIVPDVVVKPPNTLCAELFGAVPLVHGFLAPNR
jgi:hypothetical protein